MDARSALCRCSCPRCTTEVAGEGEVKSSGKLFLGPEAGNSANAKVFWSDVFFLLQGCQVEAVHLEDHTLTIFLPGAEKGLEAASSLFPAAVPVILLAGLEQCYLFLTFSLRIPINDFDIREDIVVFKPQAPSDRM